LEVHHKKELNNLKRRHQKKITAVIKAFYKGQKIDEAKIKKITDDVAVKRQEKIKTFGKKWTPKNIISEVFP